MPTTLKKDTPGITGFFERTRKNGLDELVDFLEEEIMENNATMVVEGRSMGVIYGTSTGDYKIWGSELYPINPYDGEPEF